MSATIEGPVAVGRYAEEVEALKGSAPAESEAPGGEPLIAGLEPEPLTVLDVARSFVVRYVALSDAQADAVTLWCAHTHCMDAADSTPYLRVTSDGPGAGKTRLLEVCEQLVHNPWLTGRVTGPAMVRKVGSEHLTLLLDETDALFSGGNASQQMLRGVLNSGYRRGGRVVYAKGGGVEELDVYCPKAFAGIGGLPSTVESRSIPIEMRRRTGFQPVERLRPRDVREQSRVPRQMLIRFAAQNVNLLAAARPSIPSRLDDRAADVWEPLLAIADAVGGSWPERARAAAVSLCAERRETDVETLAVRLLADCRAVFDDLGADRLQTVRLVESLRELEASPWVEEQLDASRLASLLRQFGVAPSKVRFGKVVLQGYVRRSFEGAWRLVEDVPDVAGVPDDECA